LSENITVVMVTNYSITFLNLLNHTMCLSKLIHFECWSNINEQFHPADSLCWKSL